MTINTQGVALERRLRDGASELPEKAPAAVLYREAADLIADLRAQVEQLDRDNETYRTAFDGIEPTAAQEGREAVALPRDEVERVVEIANRNEQSVEGDRLAVRLSAPAQPAAQVVVKGLRWPPECPRGQRVHGRGAPFDGVEYCIAHYSGSHGDDIVYRWAPPKGKWSEPFDSFEAAKAAAQADYEQRILSALASPTDADAAVVWRSMDSAPKDGTHVLLDIGETIPDLVDARVGQYVTEAQALELGEDVSSAGGWIIWNTGSDWFVIPFADAHGWMPLPAAPLTAAKAGEDGR